MQRAAFLLHDVFGVPFTQIGELVGRSTGACGQAASEARRAIRGRAGRTEGACQVAERVMLFLGPSTGTQLTPLPIGDGVGGLGYYRPVTRRGRCYDGLA